MLKKRSEFAYIAYRCMVCVYLFLAEPDTHTYTSYDHQILNETSSPYLKIQVIYQLDPSYPDSI